MKPNDKQQKWIDGLCNQVVKQSKVTLISDDRQCACALGVAAVVLDLHGSTDQLYTDIKKSLNLKSESGRIDWDKVSFKWKNKFADRYNDLFEMNDSAYADYEDGQIPLKVIGWFIRDNPEAIFRSDDEAV